MFAGGGAIYVYLSYGVHSCVNIVTGPAGEGQAVLLRALEPTAGLDLMATRRHLADPAKFCNGPGKLTQALGISLSLSGTHLGETLELKPSTSPVDPADIIAAPRIGISKAKDLPWRFYLANNPFVSWPR
jgi:DNA-3-methyladenine glycosylase